VIGQKLLRAALVVGALIASPFALAQQIGVSPIVVAVAQITGLGTNVATWLATPSSANLIAALTDETGTGAAVFASGPALGAFSATGLADLSNASAGQIKFPASPNLSANANTLDEYTETTSTPTPTASVGTFTTVSSALTTVKIGRMVETSGIVTITTAGTAAGQLIVTLPYTPLNGACVGVEGQATGQMVGGFLIAGTATINLLLYTGLTVIASGRTVYFSCTYEQQ
jgi:hypothetical protein